jgi:hypothetical protein
MCASWASPFERCCNSGPLLICHFRQHHVCDLVYLGTQLAHSTLCPRNVMKDQHGEKAAGKAEKRKSDRHQALPHSRHDATAE